MPAITRQGDKDSGHDQCGATPLVTYSPTTYANKKAVGREGDKYDDHGCIVHPSHQDYVKKGSPTVFADGLPIARVDDPVEKGGSVAEGSPNVYAN